ncbi:type II toxin-antitoxin system VapB family antitoxin [Sulfuricurvum sp.]|uniref:antitoxin n=1 Tax=Sulfuricurvum sp. TaxID=2025608 RepID=UPI0019B93CE7|nr:type II toxin-antitoxin system VapB family antitoxin [Sulfuricurvum sp.]MBD3805942.1 AbrB/MazE/SpoVT family DNA-binding domain-containing protein [Sulfuricurvum sp.]
MTTAKLFPNGQSQAIRIPKEFRFENQSEVFIAKEGEALIIYPKSSKFSVLFNALDQFSGDFLTERHQPEEQKREDMF